MGDLLSKPSQADPIAASAAMPEKPAEANIPNEKNPDPTADPVPAAIPSEEGPQKSIEHEEPKAEEEEEGECGFCLFMKGGGCKDTFTAWENCVAEGEKNKEDIVEKCHQETTNLKKCMEAHPDYYAPLLQAEKAAEEEAVKQLAEEKEDPASSDRDKDKVSSSSG